MVENIMYFAIGFLVASLFNLFLVPLVHNRAVRLTIRRMEASTPFSMTEIQAEKDQLRAEFAMSTRRLELSVEQLKAKTTSQLGELGKKSMVIDKLKADLSEKSEALQALEEREKATRDALQTTEQDDSDKTGRLQEMEQVLADKDAALNERSGVIDKQRLEIAALKTQIEQLRAQIEHSGNELAAAAARVREERKAAEVAAQERTNEHTKAMNFSGRIAQLERQLTTQTTEAEVLGKRAQELESRLTDQGLLLTQRESAVRQAREEVTRIKREATAAAQSNEAAKANDRVENAKLRERINDIAAEVTRLTAALEGPGSPIEAMLADNTQGASSGVNGNRAAGGEGAATPEGDLVERIRALKARVSGLNPQS